MDDVITGGDMEAAATADTSEVTPASHPDSTETPEAAPTQPPVETADVPPTTTEAPPEPKAATPGEPPKERWPDILQSARTKTRQEVEQEWAPYAWAKQVPQEVVQRMVDVSQDISRDPIGHLERFFAELESHPAHGPAVRSWAARTLASRRGQAQGEPTFEPDVEVVDSTGRVVSTAFSAERNKALIAHEVQKAVSAALVEIKPLKEAHEARAAEAKVVKLRQDANAKVDALWARAEKWPGFNDHKDAIAQAMEANPDYTLQDAYLEVVPAKLTQVARQDVLSGLHQKTAAATVSPSGGTVTRSTQKDTDRDWSDLLREEFAGLQK